MSTPCTVGYVDGDGGRGRHVNWDGYPIGVGKNVQELILRDGPERVIDVLTREHYGWSSLHPHEEPPTSYSESSYAQDPRFEWVPNYGVAYTDTEVEPGYRQTTENEWDNVVPGEAFGYDSYWMYLIDPASGRISVFTNVGDKAMFLGAYDPYGDIDWAEIEKRGNDVG